MSYRNIIGVSLIAISMAAALPAIAADKASATKAPAQASAQPATVSFTDEKLASFKAAHKKVEALNKEYSARAAGATDDTAKQQVEQLKNIDLADAVKSEGLTTAEYNQIFTARNADPALAARISAMKDPEAAETTTQ
jgi:hypothetical protein